MSTGVHLLTALIPGSFDPPTFGHLDIVGRAVRRFDQVVVGVAGNARKDSPLFSRQERVEMLLEVTSDLDRVVVESFDGLLVDFAARHGVGAIVKGLRAVSDFDYELQMAQLNFRLSGIETFFVPTAPEHSFLSSSLVREVASYGGDVSSMVPAAVVRRLKERFS